MALENKSRAVAPGQNFCGMATIASHRRDGGVRIQSKKNPARRLIEISGHSSGEVFERELRAIKRALLDTPFVVAGGALRLVITDFAWTGYRRCGFVTTRLNLATIADLRKAALARARFSLPRVVAKIHLPELMQRARRSPTASVSSIFVRLDSNGRIVCSSPPFYFGQSTKFKNW